MNYIDYSAVFSTSFWYNVRGLDNEWEYLELRQRNAIASLLISRINLFQDEIEIEWKYDFDR